MSDTPPANNVDALHDELFATLRGLRQGTVDIERAKAVSGVAQTIINAARVEVEYLKATNSGESAFLKSTRALPPGITGVRRHRLPG